MLHDRFLKSWYIVFGVFAVLTFFFVRSNQEFEREIQGKDHFSFDEIGTKENFCPQIFSPSNRLEGDFRKKLSSRFWKKWNDIIDHQNSGEARKTYTRIFWIDNVWALFLIMVIYRISFGLSCSGEPREFLAAVLLLAYFSDLLENFSYLGYTGELAWWIPQICQLKMVLYLGGAGISMLYLAGNLRSRSKGTVSS